MVTKKKPKKTAKKAAVRKVSVKAKRVPVKKAATKKAAAEKLIGRVSHYFNKIKVVAIMLKAPLKKGDTIRIEGGGKSVTTKVASMQEEHKTVVSAKKGDEVGIKILKKVREGYRVYKK